MATLKDRLEEVMRAMGWQHADVVRISQQSSSVVSQWLGKGSKDIKTIGKLEAALYLERASGYSALWIAKGIGPKMAAPSASRAALHAGEPPASYATPAQAIAALRAVLATVPQPMRAAFGEVLAAWAKEGGQDDRSAALLALLTPPGKGQRAA